MAPQNNELEIHEQILAYLYENRKSEEPVDLLKAFKDLPESAIYEKADHLRKRGLISVTYPFLGIGWLDDATGEFHFPNAEKEEYVKAKLTTDGIDYVRDFLRKNKAESVWHQIWSVAKIVFGILGGVVALFKLIEYLT